MACSRVNLPLPFTLKRQNTANVIPQASSSVTAMTQTLNIFLCVGLVKETRRFGS